MKKMATVALVSSAMIGIGGVAVADEIRELRSERNDYVTSVVGSDRDGYTVKWSNGYETWTRKSDGIKAELAQCDKIDSRIKQVRCETKVRTEFRWVQVVRETLDNERAPKTIHR